MLLLQSANLRVNLSGVRLVPHLQGNPTSLRVPPPGGRAFRGLSNPALTLLKHPLINPDLQGLPWDTQRLRTILSAERKGGIRCRVNDSVGCVAGFVELFVRGDYSRVRCGQF